MEVVKLVPRLSDFDAFWRAYPRKVAKRAARKAYDRALRETTHEAIMRGLAEFNRHLPSETQYIPHPTTWLNQGRWEDEYETAQGVDWTAEAARAV